MDNNTAAHPTLNLWISTTTPPARFEDERGCFQLLLLHPDFGIRQGYYDLRDGYFYGSVTRYRSLDDELTGEVNSEENINQNLYREVEADEQSTHWMLVELPEGIQKC